MTFIVTNDLNAAIYGQHEFFLKNIPGFFFCFICLSAAFLFFLLASCFTYLLIVLRPTSFFQKGDNLSYATGVFAAAVLLGADKIQLELREVNGP